MELSVIQKGKGLPVNQTSYFLYALLQLLFTEARTRANTCCTAKVGNLFHCVLSSDPTHCLFHDCTNMVDIVVKPEDIITHEGGDALMVGHHE